MCRICQYASSSFEPFSILSLSPTPTKKCNVEDLIKSSYADTNISYICPECGNQNSSLQRLETVKLPEVLIFHLKRFDVSNNGIGKNEQYVDFPLENLNICDSEARYSLSGITNHYGSLNAGHYTGFCRARKDGVWYRCDDSRVTKMNTQIKTSAAYLLFYAVSYTHLTLPTKA